MSVLVLVPTQPLRGAHQEHLHLLPRSVPVFRCWTPGCPSEAWMPHYNYCPACIYLATRREFKYILDQMRREELAVAHRRAALRFAGN